MSIAKLAPIRKVRRKKPTQRERQTARAKAKCTALTVAAMPSWERKRLMREMARVLTKAAPTLASATSDLLMLLNLVGAEFVKKYYPDATQALLMVSKYTERGPSEYTASIPFAVPTKA